MAYDMTWTVRELIERLKTVDQNALVHFEGAYSGGVFNIDDIKDYSVKEPNSKGYKFVHLRGGIA